MLTLVPAAAVVGLTDTKLTDGVTVKTINATESIDPPDSS
jgi:hypothetical protein